MKNKIIAGLSLTLLITSGGWFVSYDASNELTEIVVDKNKTIEQKSTEIANLDGVIVLKDKKLEAEHLVIEKHKDQLQKQEKELEENNKAIKELKAELKKKPKVIEKVVYKKANSNFEEKEKGSDVAVSEESKKEFVTVSRGATTATQNIGAFSMTSYIAMCTEGCTGITASGVDVRNTTTYQGHRIIATDTNVIPLWSIVRVNTASGSFTAISLDTGGGIDGNEIDYLVSSTEEALNNGRQTVSVEMIRRGK